jgi:hypothetical protein
VQTLPVLHEPLSIRELSHQFRGFLLHIDRGRGVG